MSDMIFDTQGTGFYKKAVRQMMAQPELTFLGSAGGGNGLGDEIMLLEGLDDLAAAYPHGYDDGPARTYTMPTMDRGTLYDFTNGPVDVSLSGSRLGASVNQNQGAWPRRGRENWNYTGLGAGWPSERRPAMYRFTGPKLGQVSVRRGRYAYTGLMGLGDAQSDARTAMLIAEQTAALGRAACNTITNTTDKARCNAGVDAALAAARASIVAGYGTDGTYAPPSGTPAPSQATADQIAEKLNQQAQQTGVESPMAREDNTMLYVGGILAVGVIAALWISRRP